MQVFWHCAFFESFLNTHIIFIIIGDGKCVICDSFVNLTEIVHICDECNYGSFEGRCVVCGNPGVTDAHYCRECVQQEKNRDGCPKVCLLVSCFCFYERLLNGSRIDLF